MKILILLAVSLTTFPAYAQDLPANLEDLAPAPFAVSVVEVTAFESPTGDQIKANGKSYWITDKLPKPIRAAVILTEGDHKKWVVIRKTAGGRSSKLASYEPNQFFYQHGGPGEYEITSLAADGEPLFDYFVIGPATGPTDPPPTGDFSGLLQIDLANPVDLPTRKKLGLALLEVLKTPLPLAELKAKVTKTRVESLSGAPIVDNTWNKWLLAVDKWLAANPQDYPGAIKALATQMAK